jgi:hypothetical protein
MKTQKYAVRLSRNTLLIIMLAITGAHSVPAKAEGKSPVNETEAVEPDSTGELKLGLDSVNFRSDAPDGNPTAMSNGSRIIAWAKEDWIFWKIKIPAKGTYKVTVTSASPRSGGDIAIEITGGQTITAAPELTDSWTDSKAWEAGTLTFENAGEFELCIRPADSNKWQGLDIYKVVLNKT